MLKESADKLDGVEIGGAWAGTTEFTVGEGDGAVCKAHDTAVGKSDLENLGGEGGEGGVAVVIGLTMHVPGDGPDLGGDVLQQSGVAHLFLDSTVVF
jgi:hypothetical protein